jgi:thiamine biosynthesis lipoprotein
MFQTRNHNFDSPYSKRNGFTSHHTGEFLTGVHMPISSPQNRRRAMSNGFKSLLADISDLLDVKEPLAFLGFDRSYVKLKREAMATVFEVILPNYEKMIKRRTASMLLDEIDRIESVFTIWKGQSELKTLNETAWKEPVKVSDDMFRLLTLAKSVFEWTEGAYDLTSTPLAKCWGFFYRDGRMPNEQEIALAKGRVGMQHVILHDKDQTVFFEKRGIELTPASIGKGYALDRAAVLAEGKDFNTFLLNGGGSSMVARGNPAWKDAWAFNIRHPFNKDQSIAQIQLKDKGFSSSGCQEQFFEQDGKQYGHIIDPRSGYPASEVVSVNVTAPTAAEAEALSTAFYVLGVEPVLKYCENHPHIGVLMILPQGKSEHTQLITINLKAQEVEVKDESCLVQRYFN